MAYQKGMAPLIYDTLKRTRLHEFREVPVSRFYYAYKRTLHNNRQAYLQLQPVLGELQAQGIDSIVLKGAAFAQLLYLDIGLRPFGDMDIMVKMEDLDRAHDVLAELGYRKTYRGLPINPPTATSRRYRSARQYFHQERRFLSIDLYWQLSRYPYLVSIDYDKMWACSPQVTLANSATRMLSPEDTILHLTLDFIMDWWYGKPEIRSLRDIAEVTIRHKVSWSELLASASDPTLRAPLFYSLTLAKEVLGANIPEEVLRQCNPDAGRWEERLVRHMHRHILETGHPAKHVLLTILMRFLGPGHYGDKAKWLAHLLPPPRLWKSAPRWLAKLFTFRSA